MASVAVSRNVRRGMSSGDICRPLDFAVCRLPTLLPLPSCMTLLNVARHLRPPQARIDNHCSQAYVNDCATGRPYTRGNACEDWPFPERRVLQ